MDNFEIMSTVANQITNVKYALMEEGREPLITLRISSVMWAIITEGTGMGIFMFPIGVPIKASQFCGADVAVF